MRQLGAAFELAALHLRWLGDDGTRRSRRPRPPSSAIAPGRQALILKGARAVNARRPADFAVLFQTMTTAWDEGLLLLAERFPE